MLRGVLWGSHPRARDELVRPVSFRTTRIGDHCSSSLASANIFAFRSEFDDLFEINLLGCQHFLFQEDAFLLEIQSLLNYPQPISFPGTTVSCAAVRISSRSHLFVSYRSTVRA